VAGEGVVNLMKYVHTRLKDKGQDYFTGKVFPLSINSPPLFHLIYSSAIVGLQDIDRVAKHPPPPPPTPTNTHNRHQQVCATGEPQVLTIPSLQDPWNRSGPLSGITVTVAPSSPRHGRRPQDANVTVSTYRG